MLLCTRLLSTLEMTALKSKIVFVVLNARRFFDLLGLVVDSIMIFCKLTEKLWSNIGKFWEKYKKNPFNGLLLFKGQNHI